MENALAPVSLDVPNTGSALSAWADTFFAYLFAYPFATCFLWSVSGLFYLLMRNRAKHLPAVSPNTLSYSVVIPFHAEPEAALIAARSLDGVTPAPLEIVIVDDGSPNPIPPEWVLPAGTRLIRMPFNMGKAGALQHALPSLAGDVVVCMDADTQTESRDWHRMLAAFDDAQLGAVTGKIRPTKGGGIVEGFQGLDYLTVIMLIKAAESLWGGLLTVSGAFTAFRASALRSIGGWSSDSATEDIDVSWRLQAAGWRLAFETDWVTRVEMAPSLRALWRQRRRWSMGLGRAMRDHGVSAVLGGARHLPIVVMTFASVVWIVSMLGFVTLYVLSRLTGIPAGLSVDTQFFSSILLASLAACYAQFACAVAVDGTSLIRHWRSALFVPLYPFYFWGLLITSFVSGFPKGCLRRDKGTWRRTARRFESDAAA